MRTNSASAGIWGRSPRRILLPRVFPIIRKFGSAFVAGRYVERNRVDLNVPTARGPRDSNGWHIDITFVANPSSYSILRGVEIPPYGGDTLFTNLQAAYENSTAQIKASGRWAAITNGASAYDMQGPPRRDGRKGSGPFVSTASACVIHPKPGKVSVSSALAAAVGILSG